MLFRSGHGLVETGEMPCESFAQKQMQTGLMVDRSPFVFFF